VDSMPKQSISAGGFILAVSMCFFRFEGIHIFIWHQPLYLT
jgi:hypothetical protein